MAKWSEKWFEHITTRYPYAIPTTFIAIGLGCLVFAADIAIEVFTSMGDEAPVLVTGPAVQPADQAGVPPSGIQVGGRASPAGAEASADGPKKPRTPQDMMRRRFGLMTGVLVMIVLGAMSISYGVLWLRLVGLERMHEAEKSNRSLWG
jgi:hypothetical protein